MLRFDDQPAQGQEGSGLQRLQHLLEKMAAGQTLSIDEWNTLANRVSVVLEKSDEETVGLSAKAGGKLDAFGWTNADVSSQGVLELDGKVAGSREHQQWITIDAQTRAVRDEYQYALSAAIAGTAGLTLSPGTKSTDNNKYSKGTAYEFDQSLPEVDGDLSGDVNLNIGMGGQVSGTTQSQRTLSSCTTIKRRHVDNSYESCEIELKVQLPANLALNDPLKKEQKARAFLDALANWSGQADWLRNCFDDPSTREQIRDQVLQASGTDMVELVMEIDHHALQRANDKLAHARQLTDTSKGTVTAQRRERAAQLEKEAEAIVKNKANYVPAKMVIIPTQTSQASYSRPWLPGTENVAASGLMSTVHPQVSFNGPGLTASARISRTKQASSKLMLGTTIPLGPRAAQSTRSQNTLPSTAASTAASAPPAPPPPSNQSVAANPPQVQQPNVQNQSGRQAQTQTNAPLTQSAQPSASDTAQHTTGQLQSQNGSTSNPAQQQTPTTATSTGPSTTATKFVKRQATTLNPSKPTPTVAAQKPVPPKSGRVFLPNLPALYLRAANIDKAILSRPRNGYIENQHNSECAVHAINAALQGPVVNTDGLTAWKQIKSLEDSLRSPVDDYFNYRSEVSGLMSRYQQQPTDSRVLTDLQRFDRNVDWKNVDVL